MYTVLKHYLENTIYTTEEAQARIDYAVARGNITPEQAEILMPIAEERGADETLADRVEKLRSEMDALVSMEIMPSDKVGYNWKNIYVKGILVRQEYEIASDTAGTSEDPIPWTPDMLLKTNGFYTYAGIRKVWMGTDNVTATWDDSGWNIF